MFRFPRASRTPHVRVKYFKAEVIISIFSLFVAVMAVIFTYDSQVLDRYYKEIAIRPNLIFSTSDSGEELFIRNDGTGPASVDFLGISERGKWEHHGVPIEGLDRYAAQNVKKVFTEDVLYLLDGELGSGIFYMRDFVLIDNFYISSILPGQSRRLFRIDKAKLRVALMSKKAQMTDIIYDEMSAKIDDVLEIFIDRTDMQACYCSITELYCSGLYSHKISDNKHSCDEKALPYQSKIDRFIFGYTNQ